MDVQDFLMIAGVVALVLIVLSQFSGLREALGISL